MDDNKPTKVKGVGFKLILEQEKGLQPIIISKENGRVWINKTDWNKLKNRRIIGFEFLNPLDHEKYAPPYIFKQRQVFLRELCGKTMVANFLW